MITQDQVRGLFYYRNGELVRRVSVGSKVKKGDIPGSDTDRGYCRVKIDGKSYFTHVLIFLWNHGYLPEKGIDHIDRDKSNNEITNLREVGQVCNMRNTGNSKANKSGVKGVAFNKQTSKWIPSITVSKKQYYLGLYNCFTEAVSHRLAAEQCIGWSKCDSSSPAFKYMQNYLKQKVESLTEDQ